MGGRAQVETQVAPPEALIELALGVALACGEVHHDEGQRGDQQGKAQILQNLGVVATWTKSRPPGRQDARF